MGSSVEYKRYPCKEDDCDFVGLSLGGLNKHNTSMHGRTPTTVEGKQAKKIRSLEASLEKANKEIGTLKARLADSQTLLQEFKQEYTIAYQLKELSTKIDKLTEARNGKH